MKNHINSYRLIIHIILIFSYITSLLVTETYTHKYGTVIVSIVIFVNNKLAYRCNKMGAVWRGDCGLGHPPPQNAGPQGSAVGVRGVPQHPTS